MSHLYFLKIGHWKDSNPCVFSVKWLFLNRKGALWQSADVTHAIDYATEAADNGGCPGGVYTCTLSYAETGQFLTGA